MCNWFENTFLQRIHTNDKHTEIARTHESLEKCPLRLQQGITLHILKYFKWKGRIITSVDKDSGKLESSFMGDGIVK